MSTGGMLPCCFVCKWAKKDLQESIPPKDKNPLIEPIACQRHSFFVWLPSSHVCADLGDPYDNSGLSKFAEREQLENGSIYAWLTFSYRTKKHPNLPQYHSECIKLAPFSQYSNWTLDQKKEFYTQTRNSREKELMN
jgi:hypothetical protein